MSHLHIQNFLITSSTECCSEHGLRRLPRCIVILKHQHTNAVADSGTKKSQSIKAKLYTIHQVELITKLIEFFEGVRLFPAFSNNSGCFAVFALILLLWISSFLLLPFPLLMKKTLPAYFTLKTQDANHSFPRSVSLTSGGYYPVNK